MKVIFLDIDGVLNCWASKSREPGGCIGIDDERVKLLRKISDATEAKIVLTSTWQQEWRPEGITDSGKYLIKKLRKEGLNVYSRTGKWSWNNRGQGIVDWITNAPEEVESWIVLHDEFYEDFPRCGIMPHLIQTDFYTDGLNDTHVERAIELLGVHE